MRAKKVPTEVARWWHAVRDIVTEIERDRESVCVRERGRKRERERESDLPRGGLKDEVPAGLLGAVAVRGLPRGLPLHLECGVATNAHSHHSARVALPAVLLAAVPVRATDHSVPENGLWGWYFVCIGVCVCVCVCVCARAKREAGFHPSVPSDCYSYHGYLRIASGISPA